MKRIAHTILRALLIRCFLFRHADATPRFCLPLRHLMLMFFVTLSLPATHMLPLRCFAYAYLHIVYDVSCRFVFAC